MTPPPLIVEWHIGGVLYGDDFCQRAYALCMLIDLAAHASEGYLPTKEIAQWKETSENSTCLEERVPPCPLRERRRTLPMWKTLYALLDDCLDSISLQDLLTAEDQGALLRCAGLQIGYVI